VNGAEALVRTLVSAGVDTCFANPGTSELHVVAALDDVPQMRGVLALFEGVATGAADGYARMAGRPAACLLHLGPGLANGLANLHNARRARSPVVNLVGDHATFHQQFDPPLQSDIAAAAGTVSIWCRTARTGLIGQDVADAVDAASEPPGGVATLVVPADVAWTSPAEPAPPHPVTPPRRVSPEAIVDAASALRSGERSALLLGGSAVRARGLRAAAQLAAATGAAVLGETFPARLERGAGLPPLERLSYLGELATAQLEGVRHLVLVDAAHPVTFFAYPGRPGDRVPEGCTVHRLAEPGEDAPAALEELVEAVGAGGAQAAGEPSRRPDLPTGDLTPDALGAALGALLPEGAVVVDEGNTAGIFAAGATAGAPPHDWLTLTGGAIGMGLPLATGAAVAAPDRRVLCLEADGSAMYTPQALWTQAREGLDVTTVVLANRAYAILAMELGRIGAGEGGAQARAMLDLAHPPLDFTSLARGLGVPAARATTADELVAAIERSLAEPGPSLVEAVLAGP
jgi:acetolactate synthase I/II/III large subunit